jgi:hypothetical protein
MFAAAISPQGVIVGLLEDPNSAYIGFERSPKGNTGTISGTVGGYRDQRIGCDHG